MNSKKLLWIVLFGVMFLFSPIFLILIIYRDALLFDPKGFINEWFKLLISLVSLFISFMLGQVYWERHQSQQKRIIIYNSLLTFLSRLYSITTDSRTLANREFAPEKYQEIDSIDSHLLENLRQLDVLKNSYFNLFSDVEVLRLSNMLDIYLYGIAPLISRLTSYQSIQTIQGDIHTIRDLLIKLEDNCVDAIDTLNRNLEGIL
jgi:hypothetical protein